MDSTGRKRTRTISVADLKRSGVSLSPDEAVAIVQKLIHERDSSAVSPPYGPPSIDNVELGIDGTVACRACEITPAVAEAAILLQALLPPGAPLPGGLRYAIARALHEVDAPPFDSLHDFSKALERYERGDRGAAVRRVLRRAASPGEGDSLPHGERRRTSQAVVDLRRHLREADRALYEQKASPRGLGVRARPFRPWRSKTAMAFTAAGVMMCTVAGWMALRGSPAGPPPVVQRASLQRDIPLPSDRASVVAGSRRLATVRAPSRARRVTTSERRSHGHMWSGIFPRVRLVDDFAATHR